MILKRGAIVVKNGRVIDPSSKINTVLDVYIEGGKFSKIGKNRLIVNDNGNTIRNHYNIRFFANLFTGHRQSCVKVRSLQ